MEETNRYKKMIILGIIMFIVELIAAIVYKDIMYLATALLWLTIATSECISMKIIKMKDGEIEYCNKIIGNQKRIIISQNDKINKFLEERKNDSTADDKR